MNEELAQLYGTNVQATNDMDALEKMAQFALLNKEAQATLGIDLNQLTPDEQAYVLNEMTKTAGAEKIAEAEAQAKLEEADYLGRVMAHAFYQEKTAIEKAAGNPMPQFMRRHLQESGELTAKQIEQATKKMVPPTASGKAVGAVGRALSGESSADLAGKVLSNQENLPTTVRRLVHRIGGGKGSQSAETYQKGVERLQNVARRGTQAAVGTAAAAGVGGGAYALGRQGKGEGGQRKAASAFDTLVDQRAYEILAANGLVAQDGSVIPPYVEKQASEFDSLVDQSALNYLAELGYQVG